MQARSTSPMVLPMHDTVVQQGSLQPSAYETAISRYSAHNQFIKARCTSLAEDGFLDDAQLSNISTAFIGDRDSCRKVVMNVFLWFDKSTENVGAFTTLQECLPHEMPAIGETPREGRLEEVLVQEFDKERSAQHEMQGDEEPTPVFVIKGRFLKAANSERTYPSEYTGDELERMVQHLTAQGHIHVPAETDGIYVAEAPENA